jgi:FkbM family methyltransferase
MKMIKRVLSKLIRIAYPYGSERRILFGPLKGWRFVVEIGHGFTYALGRDAYNFDFLEKKIRAGMVIYDVGANRGQMALFFSRKTGASGFVHAFEPAPVSFRSLQRNLALNHLDNVHAWQAVVSKSNGEEFFTFFEDDPTVSRPTRLVGMDEVTTGKSFSTTCLTLDSLVQRGERKPDILKIDVEGSAAAVLEGARNILDTARPGIYIELHSADEQRAVRDELQSRGYQLQTMDGRNIVDPTTGWFSPLWCWMEMEK